jgi:hypothetical protein
MNPNSIPPAPGKSSKVQLLKSDEKTILYAKFKTKDNHYIYDTHTNEILQVSEVLWTVIDEYLNEPSACDLALLERYGYKTKEVHQAFHEIDIGISKGYFTPCNIDRMQFSKTANENELIEHIKRRIPHLSLDVTEQCNFRCRYCTFNL